MQDRSLLLVCQATKSQVLPAPIPAIPVVASIGRAVLPEEVQATPAADTIPVPLLLALTPAAPVPQAHHIRIAVVARVVAVPAARTIPAAARAARRAVRVPAAPVRPDPPRLRRVPAVPQAAAVRIDATEFQALKKFRRVRRVILPTRRRFLDRKLSNNVYRLLGSSFGFT